MSYELRVTSKELRIKNYELLSSIKDFEAHRAKKGPLSLFCNQLKFRINNLNQKR
jgi:hypothetical protein